MKENNKLIRITTVPHSMRILLKGQLRYMTKNGFEVIGVSSPNKELDQFAEQEGIKVVPIEMTRKITPLKDLKSLWKLYQFIKKEKPFIVHTHSPKAGTLGLFAAKLAGVPNRLHTIAGLPLLEATGKKRKLLDIVEKFTYACATKVYPNSYGLYDIVLQNKYTNEKKLKVIGKGSTNGINLSYFDPKNIIEEQKNELKKKLNLQEGDFIYIFIGRLVKDKGINELISAFKMLSQTPSPKKLILVGSYEADLSPLEASTLQEIQTNPNILEVGFQNDVRPFLAISDAFVFPSYREGLPNVVMQAGAMGLPSIVTNINGCNEIIHDKINGLIIEPKNVVEIKNNLDIIYNDVNLRESLAKNARKMIVNRYQQSLVWEAILSEYKLLYKNY